MRKFCDVPPSEVSWVVDAGHLERALVRPLPLRRFWVALRLQGVRSLVTILQGRVLRCAHGALQRPRYVGCFFEGAWDPIYSSITLKHFRNTVDIPP